MSYFWRPTAGSYLASDLDDAGLSQSFDGQEEAEQWLTLFFDDLLEQGVTEVCLYEEDRLVYGPMSLNP